MKYFFYLIILLAPAAWASPRLQLQPEVSANYVFPSAAGPLLFSGSFGAVGAVWLTDDFFVGLSSQVTFTNQYSAVSSTAGNVRGSRWNPIAPFIGWRVYSDLVFRTEFEFLGDYNLTNPTSSGQNLSYQSPIGVKIIVSSPIFKAVSLGAVFEYISFSTLNNSSTGSQSLGVRTAMWCYGLQVGYAFEFFK